MPPKPRVQILLVSAQAAPNLLPALDPTMKPEEAVLMVSAKMQARADALESVLREAGVKTTRVGLDDEHDFDKLESTLFEVADEREGQQITLNLTGGTKLMALAAQSVAQDYHWPVFYVDVDTDEVIWLGKESKRQPLTQQLRLRHYLQGYGFKSEDSFSRPHISHQQQELVRTLILQVGSLEQPLGQLNWLAQEAEDTGQLQVKLSEQQLDSRSLHALLCQFEEAGVLSVQGETLRFTSEADRSFVKGGWLEHHVFRMVCNLSDKLGIRDKAANLTLVDQAGVKNELDVAFMARNRLFVIECKTSRMDGERAVKANDTLFKLSEVCKRVGGLGTRGLLASYRPLRDSEQRLARALSVELVCGVELARLSEKITSWVGAIGGK